MRGWKIINRLGNCLILGIIILIPLVFYSQCERSKLLNESNDDVEQTLNEVNQILQGIEKRKK